MKALPLRNATARSAAGFDSVEASSNCVLLQQAPPGVANTVIIPEHFKQSFISQDDIAEEGSGLKATGAGVLPQPYKSHFGNPIHRSAMKGCDAHDHM